jgi:DNA-binding response OmpR family regulator
MAPPVIAVVEYDQAVLHLLDRILTRAGYAVVSLRSRAEAEAQLLTEPPHLIILDLWLEQRDDGWELATSLQSNAATAGIPLILVSGDTQSLQERDLLLKAWRSPVLREPFDLDALLDGIHQAVGPGKNAPVGE